MSADIEILRTQFQEKKYLFTAHASDRAAQRAISSEDIETAVLAGEVIEDYPDDKYGPSCLIMGKISDSQVLHIQVSYPPPVKIITVYEPAPDQWEDDFKTRKTT